MKVSEYTSTPILRFNQLIFLLGQDLPCRQVGGSPFFLRPLADFSENKNLTFSGKIRKVGKSPMECVANLMPVKKGPFRLLL